MEQKSNTDLRDSNARARGRGQSQGALVGIGVNGLLLCWQASMKSWIILVVCCGEEQIERSFTADNKFRMFLPVTVLKMIARGKSPWSLTRESSWFTCWECHGFKELFIVTLVLSLHAVEVDVHEMRHSADAKLAHKRGLPLGRVSSFIFSLTCRSIYRFSWCLSCKEEVWKRVSKCVAWRANDGHQRWLMHFHNEGRWGTMYRQRI